MQRHGGQPASVEQVQRLPRLIKTLLAAPANELRGGEARMRNQQPSNVAQLSATLSSISTQLSLKVSEISRHPLRQPFKDTPISDCVCPGKPSRRAPGDPNQIPKLLLQYYTDRLRPAMVCRNLLKAQRHGRWQRTWRAVQPEVYQVVFRVLF